MPDRQAEISAFLAKADWQNAVRKPLAGDASARRYDRLTRPQVPHSAVLMDAPTTDGESIQPFLNVAQFLRENGFSAPEVFASDAKTGLILMEDLGDDLYARLCAKNPALEAPIYEAAIDVLAKLHRTAPPDLPPYDLAVYQREASLLTDWYLPDTSADLATEYTALIRSACGDLPEDQSVCVLRDYHAENLLWLPDRDGVARVGQLDFQDALRGHPAYDLVSLLEDARRDTDPELRAAMITRYLNLTGLDAASFRHAYAVLGAQRNLKIVGIFSRLCLRDGKAAYVDLIPRVWAHLQRDLRHPALADLRAFIDRHVDAPGPEILARIKAGKP